MVEEWKDVVGYEGYYEVSNLGRVRNAKRLNVLKALDNSKGYLAVYLGRGNKRYVHRLVAEAFIPNPNNLPEVNHSSGIKSDNTYTNLEWTTHRDNIHHAHSTGLMRYNTKLNPDKVRTIRLLSEEGHTQARISKLYLISESTVNSVVNRRTWSHVN